MKTERLFLILWLTLCIGLTVFTCGDDDDDDSDGERLACCCNDANGPGGVESYQEPDESISDQDACEDACPFSNAWICDLNDVVSVPAEDDDDDEVPEDNSELDCSGPVCSDSKTGLMWEKSSLEEFVNFADAQEVCENLILKDYDDWRLPTISELRTLVRGCPVSQTGGTCGVTDDCLAEECFNDCDRCSYDEGPGDNACYWPPNVEGICQTYSFWSTSVYEDSEDCVLVLDFHDATFIHSEIDYTGYVRCVRSML